MTFLISKRAAPYLTCLMNVATANTPRQLRNLPSLLAATGRLLLVGGLQCMNPKPLGCSRRRIRANARRGQTLGCELFASRR